MYNMTATLAAIRSSDIGKWNVHGSILNSVDLSYIMISMQSHNKQKSCL